jgi:phosphonate transport system ATP-binding protein
VLLADEPVSAMDPVLAGHTLSVLTREAQNRGVTLLASLHAVELALEHFPRIVGVRDGRIAFDKAAASVTPEDLRTLYANEQLGQQDTSSPVGKPVVVQIPRC